MIRMPIVGRHLAALTAAGFVLAGCAKQETPEAVTEAPTAPAPAAAPATSGIPDYIAAAVADPARPETDTRRDSYRKPAESVAFSMMKPGDKVVELMPGRGYFTRIFAKVVGPNGHVYAVDAPRPAMPPGGMGGPPGDMGGMGGEAGGMGGPPPGVDTFASDPTYGGNISVATQNLAQLKFNEPVDVVWTSLNYHDLVNPMFGGVDRNAMNKAIYDALKPGGVYIVIDHAAAEGAGTSVTETLHRIEPAVVRKEVEAAGFVLDGESDLLRNPLDDHTGRMAGETVQEQSDKFFFRFRKPAA